METINIQGKSFKLYLHNSEINETIRSLAKELSVDLIDKKPIFLIILSGGFVFAADLIRELPVTIENELTFLKLSSYEGIKSSGNIKEEIDLDLDLENRTVIIIEDIIETGTTLKYAIDKLKKLNPKDIKICTLFFKPERFLESYEIDYIGLSIPNNFIIGYGMDYNGMGRNLKDIYQAI